MKIKLKSVDGDGPQLVPWRQLDIGDVYDSQSSKGVCVKTCDYSYYSFTCNQLFDAEGDSAWKCIPLRAQLNYRVLR